MMRYGIFWVIMMFLCVAFSFSETGEKGKSTTSDAEIKRERRVLFDEDIKWATSRKATDEIVERIAKAGFNVYIPCVWHGRGANFATRFAHIEPMIAARVKSADDPLDYLLKQAHAQGIEVHPWFTVALRLDDRHPEFFSGETPPDSYDVHNAKFRGFMKDLIVDVVRRYPVDGINLDYIRSAGTCECPTCTAGYERRFHRSLHRDAQAARDPAARVPSIEAWHGEAVSEIVRDVSFAVRSIKPGIVISVDGYPLARWLLLQGQDSALWEQNGWIDVIFGMEYRRDIGLQDADRARLAMADPTGFTILEITYDLVDRRKVRQDEQWLVNGYEGTQAVLSREPETLAGYVRLSRERWPGSGIAFYHYKQLTDAHITELRKTVFNEFVPPAWPKTVARDRVR
jgi:uncharacterized lipoprotein YddW (UPF0748 family)